METEARARPLVTLKSLQGERASSPTLPTICMDFPSSGLPRQATSLAWDPQRSQEGVSPGQHPSLCQLLKGLATCPFPAWLLQRLRFGSCQGTGAAEARDPGEMLREDSGDAGSSTSFHVLGEPRKLPRSCAEYSFLELPGDLIYLAAR